MSRSLSFIIPGRIGGKGRPRGFIRGGKVAMYTPKQTVSDEATVRQFAHVAMVTARASMLAGPLSMRIQVFRDYPASWSKARKAQARYITGKPDCDNTAKLVADALNGIVYRDDSEIAALNIVRRYRSGAEEVIIGIMELSA